MKIAIVNDSHFGARSDSQIFLDYFTDFFREQFFPYLKENKIDTVIHLGDLMDRRKFVNFNTLSAVRNEFMEPLLRNDITVHCILGNHDTFYKNTNDLNSVNELFGDRYSNFFIYQEPTDLEFDGVKIGMVPWVNSENREGTLGYLKNTKSNIICGHFELNGYEVMRGLPFDGGMSDECLRRFDMVLSGHFHSRSVQNNVTYLGTQYQITFSDLNDRKGFHVFDTETRELEFVENPRKKFFKISYDDSKDFDISKFPFKEYKNAYVKLFVDNKTKPYLFDRFLDNLYDVPVSNVTVVEDYGSEDETEEDVDLSLDTVSIISNEVNDMKELNEEQKTKLKLMIRDLYMESLTV